MAYFGGDPGRGAERLVDVAVGADRAVDGPAWGRGKFLGWAGRSWIDLWGHPAPHPRRLIVLVADAFDGFLDDGIDMLRPLRNDASGCRNPLDLGSGTSGTWWMIQVSHCPLIQTISIETNPASVNHHTVFLYRSGMARPGGARHGMARQGPARQGKELHFTHSVLVFHSAAIVASGRGRRSRSHARPAASVGRPARRG